jgi:hypothetical protein
MKFVEDSQLNKDGHFEIYEVKLWEGSAVTFGANSLTPVVDVAKGLTKEEASTKLIELSEKFSKAIKTGKGTDERLEYIEAMFNQIQQMQKDLINLQPFVKSTAKPEVSESAFRQILLTNLK